MTKQACHDSCIAYGFIVAPAEEVNPDGQADTDGKHLTARCLCTLCCCATLLCALVYECLGFICLLPLKLREL